MTTKTSASRPLCTAKTLAGAPCRMAPLLSTNRCFNHTPTNAAKAAAARSKGGSRGRKRTKARPVAVDTVKSLQRHLAQTLGDVLQREPGLRQAMCIARLVAVGLRLIETDEMRERLEALEETVAQQTQRGY